MSKYPKFFLASLLLIMTSNLQAMEYNYLDPTKRPKEIASKVESTFSSMRALETSGWGLCNGRKHYGLLEIHQKKLAEQLYREAQTAGRTELIILDSGAGNFQSLDALCKFFNSTKRDLTDGVKVHLIGTRGEKYFGIEIEDIGRCRVYKLGAFKIESHEDQLRARIPNLPTGGIDLLLSHWTQRHLVDPLGVFVQYYNTLRPCTGLVVMDWCFYLYKGDEIKTTYEEWVKSTRNKLIDLLVYTKAPFLLENTNDGNKTHKFALQRNDNSPLRLPLAYKELYSFEGTGLINLDINASSFTVYDVRDSSYVAATEREQLENILNNASNSAILWGDEGLFNSFINRSVFEWLMPHYFYSRFNDQNTGTKHGPRGKVRLSW